MSFFFSRGDLLSCPRLFSETLESRVIGLYPGTLSVGARVSACGEWSILCAARLAGPLTRHPTIGLRLTADACRCAISHAHATLRLSLPLGRPLEAGVVTNPNHVMNYEKPLF